MSRFAELLGSTDFRGEISGGNSSARAIRPRSPRNAPRVPRLPEPDFFSVALQVLRKRKFTVIGFFLLVVLLVLGASFLMRPKYEAVARIVFNRESANPLGFKTWPTSGRQMTNILCHWIRRSKSCKATLWACKSSGSCTLIETWPS